MKTVLIVDDEKLIRKGIAVMIQRAPVSTGTILEAKDGEEAWEVLRQQEVDLLITDIRMPQVDGVSLVKKCQGLRRPPVVIVVSGFDDFGYALEMLRSGVQDYLLKPVGREDLYKALEKAEGELGRRESKMRGREESARLALQYIMLCGDPEDVRALQLAEEYQEMFYGSDLCLVCTRRAHLDLPSRFYVCGQGTLHFYVIDTREQELCRQMEAGTPLGISQGFKELGQLNKAYIQSLRNWKVSFLRRVKPGNGGHEVSNITPEKLVHLVSLSKWQEAVQLLRRQCVLAEERGTDPDIIGNLCSEFVRQINQTYPDEPDKGRGFLEVWDFGDMEDYLGALSKWLETLTETIREKYFDYENKNKILKAEAYIRENYYKPINMTVVSNYVSMNYTLFSVIFKRYTGKNFITYLQCVRVEEAKRMLSDTKLKVYQISAGCGFQDDKHFLKVFKSVTGYSPMEWRSISRVQADNKAE